MVKQKGNPHAAKSNDFISAVRDIKKLSTFSSELQNILTLLAFESLSAKEKRIENKNKAYKQKNAKMPIFMLKGIRNKAVERFKQREEELREVKNYFIEKKLTLSRDKFCMIHQ